MTISPGKFSSLAVKDGIATVTINRPKRLNALHPAAHHELSGLFDSLPCDKNIRVVIITGHGRAFCVGYDLKDAAETGHAELPASGFGGITNRADYPLAVIAAVNGFAFGGGFEIALACDLVVASTAASFAFPEHRVGWSPLAGGLQRLPQAIGVKAAMDLILTGRQVSPDEGLRLGFVNRICTPKLLAKTARALAASVAEGSPAAIRCSKQVVYQGAHKGSFEALMDIDSYSQARRMIESEDAIEGKRAFVEKRKPVWTGH